VKGTELFAYLTDTRKLTQRHLSHLSLTPELQSLRKEYQEKVKNRRRLKNEPKKLEDRGKNDQTRT
jgi:hypothetical protein